MGKRNWMLVGGELNGCGTDRTREIEFCWVVNWKGEGQLGLEKLRVGVWWTEREWDRWDKRSWMLLGGELKEIWTVGTREIGCWWVVNWKGVEQMGQEKLNFAGWWTEREWDKWDKRNWVLVGGWLNGSGAVGTRGIVCWWVVNWKGVGRSDKKNWGMVWWRDV